MKFNEEELKALMEAVDEQSCSDDNPIWQALYDKLDEELTNRF